MSGFYHITVGSLLDYEDLVAEIYINGRFVGLISQEQAQGEFLLELSVREGKEPAAIDLALFENAVAEAKDKLHKLKRAPTSGYLPQGVNRPSLASLMTLPD